MSKLGLQTFKKTLNSKFVLYLSDPIEDSSLLSKFYTFSVNVSLSFINPNDVTIKSYHLF